MRAGLYIAVLTLAFSSVYTRTLNGCLEFDGVESRAEIRGLEGLESLDGDSTYTFEVWIKPRTQGGSGRGRLLDQVGSSLTWYLSDEGRFGFRPNRTLGWQLCDLGAICYWEWQHVAITSDGHTLRFFVNGKLLTATPGNTELSITKRPILIGNGEGDDQTSRGFDGWMDGLRVDSSCRWTSDFSPPDRGTVVELDSTCVLLCSFDRFGGQTIALDESTYNSVVHLESGAALGVEP